MEKGSAKAIFEGPSRVPLRTTEGPCIFWLWQNKGNGYEFRET
jgi:hypothetical protein